MNKLKLLIMCSLFSCGSTTNAQESVYDIKIKSITGEKIDLAEFEGKKILFVNVASDCGFTKQYTGLEELHQLYKDKLVIIGLPCNQFGGQESGTEEEIVQFCEINYGVTFLLTEKIEVKGEGMHPLYKWLCTKEINGKSNSTVKWNFQKYLVDENGEFVNYFYSTTKPMSSNIIDNLK
ncbi:MAG: glutathione peroxidase [Flavobacteriales bacterium]|jgi:glutathione peroxidase|nr:glutathione peroxidase [Flavobacteriales bacterium]